MKKFIIILFLPILLNCQINLLNDETVQLRVNPAHDKISDFLYNYNNVVVGSDNLLNIVIEGSSIFGLNNNSQYGYADTTSCQFGIWSKLQAYHLDTMLNYSTSDLKYYNRYNTDIVYGGTWYPENGQWASYYDQGKKYRETNENGAYVEIEVTGVKFLAIVFEAQNAGDSMRVTINTTLPSVAGITGKDTISTNYARSGYWISLKHEYYSGLDPATTYTFRFTKLRNNTAKYCKIAGFMTWSLPSVNIITTAETGVSGTNMKDRFYENVTVHNPDLVIWQTHDVNDISETDVTYSNHSAFIDSLETHDYQYIALIPNSREPQNSSHYIAYQKVKLLLSTREIPYLDFYQYFRSKSGLCAYDGVHPKLTSVIEYVDKIGDVFGAKNRNANYFASMYAQLDSTQKARINTVTTMLEDSLNSSIESRFDFLYLFANGTEEGGLKNLARRSFDAQNIHSTAWTQYEGFTGDGANDYINTTYRLAVDTINVRRYSNAFGVYMRTSISEADKAIIGGYNTASPYQFSRIYVSQAVTIGSSINSATGLLNTTLADNKGTIISSRLANDNVRLYLNGTEIKTGTNAALALTPITVPVLVQITNAGAFSGYSARQVAIAFWSSGLTLTEQRMVKNCFEWYMDSLGKGVVP